MPSLFEADISCLLYTSLHHIDGGADPQRHGNNQGHQRHDDGGDKRRHQRYVFRIVFPVSYTHLLSK